MRVKHGKDRPREIIGDSAYDNREIREYLKHRGIKANIDINKRSKPKCGRPYRLDRKMYKSVKNTVERVSHS